MFHLPHNAIIPEEVIFILNQIDTSKTYYLYDELKALMFEQEIKQHTFEDFHPGMYKNFQNDRKLKKIYDDVLNGSKHYNDVKGYQYTQNKTLNGCWNEQARDYFEFIAFTGLMPSYYKGGSFENEKRYYIGETLKQYKKGEINYSDILFKMKFRNASKNYNSIEQYDVRNRPFVVALKIMDIFKKKGKSFITKNTLSYYVRTIKDEDNINANTVEEIDENSYDKNYIREIGRGATFLRQHIEKYLNVKTVKLGRSYVYSLNDFNIENYNIKKNAIFIGDYFEEEDIEVTPKLIKSMKSPLTITDIEYKNKLKRLGLISDTEALYDFNIDTDLGDRNLVLQVLTDEVYADITATQHIETFRNFAEGKRISESGNGKEYEEFLFDLLKYKFGNDKITYYGANTTGQRVSDIVCNLKLFDEGNFINIKLIVEAKSGGAIKSFDERKEKDDIINKLNKYNTSDYNGIWYIVVDSNQIPTTSGHGGFRATDNKLNFKQKLLKIQAHVMQSTMKMTMVTAFSYVEFIKFIISIDNIGINSYISKIQAPDFWTWSSKFIDDSFVTIRG